MATLYAQGDYFAVYLYVQVDYSELSIEPMHDLQARPATLLMHVAVHTASCSSWKGHLTCLPLHLEADGGLMHCGMLAGLAQILEPLSWIAINANAFIFDASCFFIISALTKKTLNFLASKVLLIQP